MSSKDKNFETKRFKTSDVNKKTKKNVNSETQRIGVLKDKDKSKKAGKVEKNKFKNRHPKLLMTIKIALVVIMLVMIIFAGVVAGTFFGLFGDELRISQEDLVISFENSTVYDNNDNEIAVLSGGTKRKSVSLSEMSKYLPKAYVAIEDERFYSHSGIDIKRFTAAVVTYAIHAGNSSFGGSTITQQVIKNLTEEKASTGLSGILRKVKEISKSIQVEHYLSKDQILELYLNLIYIGGGDDINGVALGAVHYFDKEVKDLSIAECAFMAGINHTPNSYKPFTENEKDSMKEKINKRTKTVLSKMKELGYITIDEYDMAIAEVDEGLHFKNGDANVTTEVSYHTEAAISEVVNQVMEEKGINKKTAELYIYSGGLKIYTTQNTEMQNKIEEELAKEKYLVSSKKKNGEKQTSMANMVIVDHTTGKVVASGSGIGSDMIKTKLGYYNWPTGMKKQTGSAMKPIAVIAPGLETGTITASTIYDDNPTTFGGNYSPKNYYSGFKGLITIRSAIEISANIPHVKALSNIGVEKSIAFCKKVGITELKNEGLSLALGGLEKGVTTLQMAAAYAAIANDGLYIEPTFYEKVTDNKGNIILEPKQKSERVMSEANAYVEKSILTQPVIGASGTASYCAISGMDVAAKTGTTNDDYDRWLCGFTPYYTAAVWFGYEENATVVYSGNPAGKIWDAVMSSVHSGLANKKFEMPKGVVTLSICKNSGKKATSSCANVYNEVFSEKNQPDNCDGHVKLLICTESGLIANESCTSVEEKIYTKPPEKEDNPTWVTKGTSYAVPTQNCTIQHTVAHEHTFSEAITKAPTITTTGVKTITCTTCGYSYTEEIPVQEHTHSYTASSTVTKQPTCTEAGEKVLKCSCGAEKKEIIAAKGHSYGDPVIITAATCITEGEQKRTCSACNDVKTEKIAKLPHTYNNITHECTTPGCKAIDPNYIQSPPVVP